MIRPIRDLYHRLTGTGSVHVYACPNGGYNVCVYDREGGLVYPPEHQRNVVYAIQRADRIKAEQDERWRTWLWRMQGGQKYVV